MKLAANVAGVCLHNYGGVLLSGRTLSQATQTLDLSSNINKQKRGSEGLFWRPVAETDVDQSP